MTRFTKSANGKYMVHGKSYDMLIGSRAQVWHGTSYKTSGGLTKANIMQNKSGRIVSKAKHATAKKDNRLVKAGYGTKKGTFGYVKLNKRGGGFFKDVTGKSFNNDNNNKGSGISSKIPNPFKGGKSRKQRGGINWNKIVGKIKGGGVNPLQNTVNSSIASTSRMLSSIRGGKSRKQKGGTITSQVSTLMNQSKGDLTQASALVSRNANAANTYAQRAASTASQAYTLSRQSGGSGMNSLSPSSYNGAGVGTSGVDLQFVAGNAA